MSAFKPESSSELILGVLICSDGSESLILIVHNRADPQSNGCLIHASESSISSYLVLS